MDTIDTRIMASLEGRHDIFFAENVALEGVTQKAIRFALASLVKDGRLVRLAWGIYCNPPLEAYSNRRILPSPFAIAQAIAKRGNLTLIPHGATAAARVGLTSEVPNELVFLSTGCTRNIGLPDGKTIKMVNSSESRRFNFVDDRMRDLSNGLRYIGEARVGDHERDAVRLALRDVPEENYRADLEKCPEWVRDILEDARKGNREKKNAQ